MTHRISRRTALAGIGAATAATLAAPGVLRAETRKVQVGALRFTSHAASFVAMERGYFAEAGLDVEFTFFQAAQPMAVAIASGDVGYGVTAVTGGLLSLANKGAAKVIGGALREEPGIPGQAILASNAAHADGLTAPSALGGRSFGMTTAGSSFHYMGSRIAQAEGVDLSFKPLQKVPAVIGALKSGQVDAWAIVPHIARSLIASEGAMKIGAVSDYLPDYQVTTVFTSAEAAANERGRSEAFLAAFARGAADFNAALVDKTEGDEAAAEMVALLHKYVYTDRRLEKADGPIRAGAMRLSEGAALGMSSVADQVAWFSEAGLVESSVETLVDPSYVESV